MNRREFIIGSAAFAGAAVAAEKTVDGGLTEVSWAERRKREIPRLPAGAGNARRFATRCLGCHLCAAVCPSDVLRPSTEISRLGKVELDFRHGFCRPDCVRCGAVCPVNAIERLTVAEKRDVRIGVAVWHRDRCVRTTQGDECHACEKHCPVKAIRLVDGFPHVDPNACTGCGACEHYCPAHLPDPDRQPLSAIEVVGFDYHRVVRPMSEADLIAEMKALLTRGKTLVVARDGVIVFTSEERMIAPIRAALAKDAGMLDGAVVADKVVGKAAAKMHAEAGVRRIVTPIVAAGAKAWLEARGITVDAAEVVPMILNRDRTAECPLDLATEL